MYDNLYARRYPAQKGFVGREVMPCLLALRQSRSAHRHQHWDHRVLLSMRFISTWMAR